MRISRRNRWRRTTTSPSKTLVAVTFLSVAVAFESLPLRAQETQAPQERTVQEGQRRVHVVRRGDTLWDLAQFYLDDPFLWPEIYRLNTMVVEDPHWIYPEEQLELPFPGEVAQRPDTMPAEEPRPPQEEPVLTGERRTIFARREVGARRTLVYQPTAPVPLSVVSEGDFRRSGMLLPLAELGPRGRVVDYIAPSVIRSDLPPTVPVYGRIYVSHPDGAVPELGDRILLFRIERQVRPYGRVIRPTGLATIAAVHEDVSTAVVTELYDRVLIGDQTAHIREFEERPGVRPEAVASGPAGELVAFLDRQPVASVEDVAFINVGRSQGVTVGDEFEVYLDQRESPGGLSLPEEHVAVGRVVRVTERTATIRLIKMRHPAIEVGIPVRMVRKMPS